MRRTRSTAPCRSALHARTKTMNHLFAPTATHAHLQGIIPAILSGAIDIIVVRHQDRCGDASAARPDSCPNSSPFHVRFGKIHIPSPTAPMHVIYICRPR